MRRKIHLFVMLLALLIAFTGCAGKEPSIVGEWYSEQDQITMTISPNGTFSVIDETTEHGVLLTGTYRIEGNKFLYTPHDEVELTNDFTLKGDILTLTYQNYSSSFKRVKK